MTFTPDESCLLPHLRMPERFVSFCEYVKGLREKAGVEPATELQLQGMFDMIWTTFG